LIDHPERTLNAAEIDAVISQTLAREALAAEQARRAVWRRTIGNSENFAHRRRTEQRPPLPMLGPKRTWSVKLSCRSLTRSGLGRPLPSLIRSSSRRRRDRLDDIRCAPVINSLLPRATSVVSPWAAQPVPIPTSATIVAPNSAFVIARTTPIVIPRSGRKAGTDHTGIVAVRSPPVVSTGNAGNAQGGQGSTDLRLSTLERQRDAALRRPAKGKQYRTREG